MPETLDRLRLRLFLCCVPILFIVLPLPVLLRFIFTFFWGLVLLTAGGYLGALAIDTSLRICHDERNAGNHHWMLIPSTAIAFVALYPPLAFQLWHSILLPHRYYLSSQLLVIIFMSLIPLVLGPLLYWRWRNKNLKMRMRSPEMSTRLTLKLVLQSLVVVLIVLPLPVLLTFMFTFFYGLVLLTVGAYVGILAFDTSLRIGRAKRIKWSPYWIVTPLTAITFFLFIPPIEFWVVSTVFWEYWWFNHILVMIFLSIPPIVLGPLSFWRWKKNL